VVKAALCIEFCRVSHFAVANLPGCEGDELHCIDFFKESLRHVMVVYVHLIFNFGSF